LRELNRLVEIDSTALALSWGPAFGIVLRHENRHLLMNGAVHGPRKQATALVPLPTRARQQRTSWIEPGIGEPDVHRWPQQANTGAFRKRTLAIGVESYRALNAVAAAQTRHTGRRRCMTKSTAQEVAAPASC
jgi:hypothetical protein